jgi:hypothetical protein
MIKKIIVRQTQLLQQAINPIGDDENSDDEQVQDDDLIAIRIEN